MTRVEQVRAAAEALSKVFVGNDHPCYDTVQKLRNDLHALAMDFYRASQSGWDA